METIKPARQFAVCVVLLNAFAMGFRAGANGSEAAPRSAPQPTPTMAGRILDGDGKAVEGADVYLFARESIDQPETRRRAARTAADGKYRFEKLANRAYLVAVKARGFAKAYCVVKLQDDDRLAADVVVRPPGDVSIRVQTADGKPVSGARIRELWLQDANGSSFFENRVFDDPSFNLVIPPSDATGQLQLRALPQGAAVNLFVEHPDFVQVNLSDVIVKPRTTVEAVLHAGVTLRLQMNPRELAAMGSPPTLRLDRAPHDSGPSTYFGHPLTFDKQGIARLTVEPGRYNQLALEHADYLIGPRISGDSARGKFLSMARGSNDQFSFQSHRKIVAHGRVVDETTGKPVVDEIVIGEVLSAGLPDASGKPTTEWMWAKNTRTGAKGEYTLPLAAGRGRVRCRKNYFMSDPDTLQFAVSATGPSTILELRIHPTPKVRGRVVGPDGRPVPKTVVRFRGPYLRWMLPAVTDAQGRFELQPEFMPLDDDDKRVFVHPLVAFHAYEPLGARTDVHLDSPESFSDITLNLGPEPYERQLDEVANDWTAWKKRGSSGGHVRKQARGGLVPQLDCRL
jgi:protocatechuate 3,4-dioxygenase beta subunit